MRQWCQVLAEDRKQQAGLRGPNPLDSLTQAPWCCLQPSCRDNQIQPQFGVECLVLGPAHATLSPDRRASPPADRTQPAGDGWAGPWSAQSLRVCDQEWQSTGLLQQLHTLL